jgi:hypothetical protein
MPDFLLKGLMRVMFNDIFGRVMFTDLLLLFWEWFREALRLKGLFGQDLV